jgi:hypothetical protein
MKIKLLFWLVVALIILVCISPIFMGCTREVEKPKIVENYKIDSTWLWEFNSGDETHSDTILGHMFYTFSNDKFRFAVPTGFKYGLTVTRKDFDFLTETGKIAITDSFNNYHRNNWDFKLFPGILK